MIRFKYLRNNPLNIPLADTSPAIFISTKDGTGRGAIPIYPQYSSNSVDNPARKGSVIVMFATGFGVWNPPVPDGAITLWVNRFSAQPVSLTIGGQPAELYYVGTSPYQLWGTVQVTAFVPTNIGSGGQPVVLKVGNNDNAQQKVTIFPIASLMACQSSNLAFHLKARSWGSTSIPINIPVGQAPNTIQLRVTGGGK